MSRIASIAATIGLGIAGVIGLFMSLCGGIVSAVSLGGASSDPYSKAVFVISLPSLLIGLGVLWWVVLALRRRAARRAATALRTMTSEPFDDGPAAK